MTFLYNWHDFQREIFGESILPKSISLPPVAARHPPFQGWIVFPAASRHFAMGSEAV